MAKLFVVQDRYNEDTTQWHIFTNEAKAYKKYDELKAEYEEDWQVKIKSVSGPNCGFLIGFDDDLGEVFAESIFDVRGYKLDSYYGNTTAYLIGPKSKEGSILVSTYNELELYGKLEELAYWEQSKLINDNNPYKPGTDINGNQTLKFFYIEPTWPIDPRTGGTSSDFSLDKELTWYIYTNEAKAKKKHKELLDKFGDGKGSDYWGRDLEQVEGSNCGVLGAIQPKSVIALGTRTLNDIASDIKEWGPNDMIKNNAAAFIVRPKSNKAEGTITWSGGKFKVSNGLEEVAIWKNSKLIKGSIPENAQTVDGLKYVQLFEGFVKNLNG